MGQDINIKNEQLFQDEANSGKVTESDLCPKARTLLNKDGRTSGSKIRWKPEEILSISSHPFTIKNC